MVTAPSLLLSSFLKLLRPKLPVKLRFRFSIFSKINDHFSKFQLSSFQNLLHIKKSRSVYFKPKKKRNPKQQTLNLTNWYHMSVQTRQDNPFKNPFLSNINHHKWTFLLGLIHRLVWCIDRKMWIRDKSFKFLQTFTFAPCKKGNADYNWRMC